MRFRATIRNINTFTKLTGSLLLLSKVVWIRFDNDQIRLTVIPERGSQVWAVLSIDSIFEEYSVQSNTPGNTINLQVSLTHLNRALRSAINATSASIRLTKKDGIPLLALTITTTTFASLRRPPTLEDTNDHRLPSEAPELASTTELDRGNDEPPTPFSSDRETTITQSVAVTVLAPEAVASIHEPTCREPDVHILLPPLLQLKAISERFTKLALPNPTAANAENQSTRLILSASPYGEFRIGVQTAACKIESKWHGLTNPELDPTRVEGGEEVVREHASTRQKQRRRDEAWATVRVEGRDWGRVLGVGRLGGRVVACFCDDHALILYVYLVTDETGADDSVLTLGLSDERHGIGLASSFNMLNEARDPPSGVADVGRKYHAVPAQRSQIHHPLPWSITTSPLLQGFCRTSKTGPNCLRQEVKIYEISLSSSTISSKAVSLFEWWISRD
ncbi:MAG: hypothetical protein Q9178_006622 [Gyalolechia marmorata]